MNDNTGAVENGEIVHAPEFPFELGGGERRFLSPAWLHGGNKNISFDPRTNALRGSSAAGADLEELRETMRRFSSAAQAAVSGLFPRYKDHLQWGLASFRPAEVAGRVSSWRKDDTRLHVDTFPSRPTGGQRILRVFVNVGTTARHWQTGEPFPDVAQRFFPQVRRPLPGTSWLLQRLGITKGLRTPYDHLMLRIHDAMKADQSYQTQTRRTDILFPPAAAWICFTDSVSHAVISGQFAFEQTFYLPVGAMEEPVRSPLRILEHLQGRTLV